VINNLQITRYPKTNNSSLRAWSAADELLLEHWDQETGKTAIYNDRFGYLSTHLQPNSPFIVSTYKSQEKAILQNIEKNYQDATVAFHSPLEKLPEPIESAIVKIPKSMDLFRLFLIHIHQNATKETTVLCGFMTKHFTKQMLEIAGEYFESITQSKAKKKARVLILSIPNSEVPSEIINKIDYTDKNEKLFSLSQYYGVFSAKHIDYATQFFLDNVAISEQHKNVIDIASGNGVIAKVISERNDFEEIHLMDDSYLAIASSKLNIQKENITFHYENSMAHLEPDSFDLAVCNPPFHFEHENTIEIALSLFQGIYNCLRIKGEFQCVANHHLNYKTHLFSIFGNVEIINENNKFVIYRCKKS